MFDKYLNQNGTTILLPSHYEVVLTWRGLWRVLRGGQVWIGPVLVTRRGLAGARRVQPPRS